MESLHQYQPYQFLSSLLTRIKSVNVMAPSCFWPCPGLFCRWRRSSALSQLQFLSILFTVQLWWSNHLSKSKRGSTCSLCVAYEFNSLTKGKALNLNARRALCSHTILIDRSQANVSSCATFTMETPQEDDRVVLPTPWNINSKACCNKCGMTAELSGQCLDQCLLEVPLMQDHQEWKKRPAMEERGQIASPPYSKVLRMAAAEMVAVFLIMFSACGTAIVDKKNNGDLTLLGLATAGGLSVMMMVFAVGHISGAHLNPAVTIAFASKKLFPFQLVPIYAFAQFLGALVAAAVLRALTNDAEAALTLPYGGNVKAFIVELVLGFNLMFVATAVSTGSSNRGELAGIAVGATVILNVLLAGTVSGASMNPMRTLGPAIVANKYDSIWIYLIAPPLGALAGTWTHTLLQIGT